MKVPFLDLKAQYDAVGSSILEKIQEVAENSAFALGYAVDEFEKNFADFCNVSYCVACNSGTSALHLALLAAGVKAGDEVITVSHTFIATVWSISYIGAKPVLVDVDSKTYNMDPNEIESKITDKTKLIIPVHLYGQPAEMDKIMEIAKKHNLIVIEDASQAHGAEYKGKKVGTFGEMATFSFYPGKNLGAWGEGGAIVTNNKDLSDKMKSLRNHSQSVKYVHTAIGYNFRMDGIQGAVLNEKLKYLNKWNDRRLEIALRYNTLLGGVDKVTTPFIPDYAKAIFHLYELKLQSEADRQSLITYLQSFDIHTGLHYPIPVHLQEPYKYLGHKVGDFPITENLAETLLSLPIYPEMTDDMVDYVVSKVKEWAK